jgi:DNA-binding transcriptional LysR family regulator
MSDKSDLSIPEIAFFVAVAKTGSFTRAAENLGSSKSNVGKAIQRLETRLKTRLFQRTTRTVRLTEDGEIYLQASQAALDGLKDAELSLAARRAEPIGNVKLDLPAGLGRLFLPTLSLIREKYPQITLELALSDRMSDVVGEGWDIVVRIAHLPNDGTITVRKLCDLRLGLYASTDYLNKHYPINSIADLTGQDAVIYRSPTTGRLRPWALMDGTTTRDIAPAPSIVLSDGQAMVEATVGGFGISQLLDKVASPYVAAGKLKHLLPHADVEGPPVYALIPLGQRMGAKTRVVLNLLAETLR